MSESEFLTDILDAPPIEAKADEAQTFATYKNYLLSLSKFIHTQFLRGYFCPYWKTLLFRMTIACIRGGRRSLQMPLHPEK